MPGLLTRGLGLGGPLVTRGLGGGPPSVPVQRRTDYLALLDVQARLLATGAFREVFLGVEPGEAEAPADVAPGLAVGWVRRQDARESDRSSDTIDREVQFRVWVEVRERDDALAFKALDALVFTAQNAIVEQPIAGFCRPALTSLARGRDDRRVPRPRRRVEMEGSLVYGVTPTTARTIDPAY